MQNLKVIGYRCRACGRQYKLHATVVQHAKKEHGGFPLLQVRAVFEGPEPLDQDHAPMRRRREHLGF